jgi:class 3 adenylate cyclase
VAHALATVCEPRAQVNTPSQIFLILFVWLLMTSMCLYGSRNSERAARQDFLLQLELRASRQMAQSMLSNMLPDEVVSKLQNTPGMVLASEEPLVSVLFCDIVDFHSIVAKLSAVELVTLLDRTWSKFDLLSEKHGVVKMETVGATYMAVGGLHMKDCCQAVEITRMAFECCDIVSKIYHGEENTPLQVRIGLHCGPVLSGVVGTKKPQFSLFGDTVNTAARMQSTGEAMGVQMSQVLHTEWLAATESMHAERDGLVWETREVKVRAA